MTGTAPTEYVVDRRESLVESTLDLLAIDTSNPPGETGEAVTHLESELDGLGVEVERFTADPMKPNLLVTVPGEREQTLLYNGHLDTVPFDPNAWTYDPLGERIDNRLYGRGATDMKGQVAAMLETIRAFAETDTTPPLTLQFAFVSDEEVAGDAGLRALLEANYIDADACVIGEPTCKANRHSVTVADRGSIWLTLEGQGDAAHGSRPVLGVNAIDRVYRAVETIRGRLGEKRLDIDPAHRPIIEESVEYYAPTMGEQTARDLFQYPSINLGVLEGGDAVNRVPPWARAELDVRLSPGVPTGEILSDLRACVDDCEGVSIADVSWSVGTAELPNSPLVEAVVSTAEKVTNSRVYRRSATGGGDAKLLRNAGVPTVEFGLGSATVHAVDEYTTVDALADNATVYTTVPFRLASDGGL